MSTCTLPELNSLTDWIETTDDHAQHHLALLAHVQAALDAEAASPAERASLAQKVERWRYQHLNEHAGALTPPSEALVDSLDQAARQLAGRGQLAPRRTRHAVHDPGLDKASIREACEALDPSYPLSLLTERAARLTQQHFPGSAATASKRARRHRMLLYAPVYVSSDCVNYCLYCGFRYPLQIPRRHLTVAESLDQARILRQRGFQNILIVGGEFPSQTTPAYYRQIIQALADDGFEPGIEIAPQTIDAYSGLAAAGACSLTLYQETYDRALYAQYHTRGPKASYDWRLESHDRAAEAGIPRLGLGVLLGLAEPRADLLATLRHAAYLSDRFPDRTLAFSLPRIHEAPEGFEIPFAVSDEDLIRAYCAVRIAFPHAVLVLSTREQADLRNTLAKICITQMSAGSSTAPGGYGPHDPSQDAGEQFPVSDHRSPAEVSSWLEHEGFEIAWTAKA
ncbi:MAG: radical SAM protein [Pirellulaceae bacterium]|nr:radical SAM protein [Pirellulaceae bacterium]MCU0977773.1 radical SAM protein [Pirellulaceae bacterium]